MIVEIFLDLVLRVGVAIYLIGAYVFLFLYYVIYIFGRPKLEDFMVATLFLLLGPPFFIPMGIILSVGLFIVKVFVGILIILLFSLIALLYIINSRFPLGGILKAWLAAAKWLFDRMRKFFDSLGIFQTPLFSRMNP